MKTLVDITAIHRVGTVLTSAPTDMVRADDAVAILHFAEHLLFSDEVAFVSFDEPRISGVTYDVIETLEKHQCLPKGEEIAQPVAPQARDCRLGNIKGRIVADYEASFEFYRQCCRSAALKASDTLCGWLTREVITKMAGMMSESIRPKHSTVDHVSSLLGIQDALEIRQARALDDLSVAKADAAVRYMLLAIDQLRGALKKMERDTGPFSSSEDEALRVILRMQLNHVLAEELGFRYAPVPQRAKCDEKLEQTFRQSLNTMLWKLAKEKRSQNQIWNGLVESLTTKEHLPLPSLALHALRQRQDCGPIGLLRSAAELRNSKEIRAVREWLNEWEDAEHKGQRREQDKAAQEIRDCEKMLKVKLGLNPPHSILRASYDTLVSILKWELPEGKDLEEIFTSGASPLWPTARRAKAFLTMVAKDLGTEKELGEWLMRALDRTIEIA
ncbi:MAG: hypothetical protein HY735_09650 [Verrucomicrobia bacterium]|nr:hypothetical protein [Verrucomicrobiota bacterium]